MQSSDALLEAVKEFNGSFVMVTHNEMFLNRLATHLIVFDDDRVFMFRGKYSDFLKDVGWKDEGIVRDVKKDSASGKDNYQDKKAAKKTAARLRQERSDILGPLKDKIRSLEKRITGLENELHLNTHALVEASFKGDAAKIEGFSKKTHALRSQIESFYDELDKTTCECEKKESEFDSKLKELADA
jgi:ATP-binding cassette subfamily F protein 3